MSTKLPAEAVMAVCRWSMGGATQHGWRTTRLSPADFAGCRSGLKNWRSAASDQMITVSLPATTRNYMLLTPLYLSFSGIAARRMPSARCTLTPCSFCTWESKEVGSPAILAARKTEYVISAHDAISPTLALTRAPSRRALVGQLPCPTVAARRSSFTHTLLHRASMSGVPCFTVFSTFASRQLFSNITPYSLLRSSRIQPVSRSSPIAIALPAWLSANVHNCLPCIIRPCHCGAEELYCAT